MGGTVIYLGSRDFFKLDRLITTVPHFSGCGTNSRVRVSSLTCLGTPVSHLGTFDRVFLEVNGRPSRQGSVRLMA